MINKLFDALIVLSLILGFGYFYEQSQKSKPLAIPELPKLPDLPKLPKLPDPPKFPKPWGTESLGPVGPNGTEPQVDFPEWEWMENVGSRLDGAGMCVFTSTELMLLWAGLEEFRGFRDWCAQRYSGGGYPSKLAKLVKAYCRAMKIPTEVFDPDRHLIQYEGQSTELLEAALRVGSLPCVTLYRGDRYRGTIYHMVNCAHLDSKYGAILDNNFKPLEWGTRDATIRKMKMRGEIWVVAVALPGPPPLPRNL